MGKRDRDADLGRKWNGQRGWHDWHARASEDRELIALAGRDCTA